MKHLVLVSAILLLMINNRAHGQKQGQERMDSLLAEVSKLSEDTNKVKTGGLPVANKTHAEDIVSVALEMRNFMLHEQRKREASGRPFFEIRIGCNTGSVVAGIVGTRKFAYDIWGDAVNLASRMESSGEPGKINISGTTYALVKENFVCVHRGKLNAKNKGMVDMYFVENA